MTEHFYRLLGLVVLIAIIVGPFVYPKPKEAYAATVIIYLTTTGVNTWTVPSDWNSTFNSIEVIGGGGGANGGALGGSGGGGGAYSKITGLSLTPGASVTYQVGTGGSGINGVTATVGGDTFFNRTAGSANTCADTTSVCAKGGGRGNGTTLGSGGASASGTGSTKFSGGNGGTGGSSNVGSGGGAAGPVGAGNNGSTGSTSGSGDAGQGGAGKALNGGTGTTGQEYDTTHGSGGGGAANSTTAGGNGGLYGGGAGAGTSATGGTGAQGLIIITYSTTAPGSSSGVVFSSTTKFSSTLSVVGALSKGSGTFLIDHPQDPSNKLLFHSFVESPEVKNVYDGIAVFDENGNATVTLPSYFDALNGEVRYQFTPLTEAMPNIHVGAVESKNSFTLSGGVPGGKVSWQVTGVRHDPYILKNPIKVEVEKGPDEPLNKGECVYEPLCK